VSLLTLHAVSKTFGDFTALKDINFVLHEGEVVGLVGPNGAGKSTLLNVISGRLKPSCGEVRFDNVLISGLKPQRICRLGISRTFQSSRLFAGMSALDNILAARLFGKRCRPRITGQDRDAARRALAFVGMTHKADTPAGDLTLSEQRRLDLARALATRPRLLLLDEIAAGFSPVLVKQAVSLVKKVRARGVTILIIDHFLNLSVRVSDRLLALDHGEKVAAGPPAEVLRNPDVMRAYLGLRHEGPGHTFRGTHAG